MSPDWILNALKQRRDLERRDSDEYRVWNALVAFVTAATRGNSNYISTTKGPQPRVSIQQPQRQRREVQYDYSPEDDDDELVDPDGTL